MEAVAKRWNSFVCPGCRLVFRVPDDSDSPGVVCPSCGATLRLPGVDDVVSPLVIPSHEASDDDLAEPGDAVSSADDSSEDDDVGSRGDWGFVAALACGVLAAVAAVAWWMLADKGGDSPDLVGTPVPEVTPADTDDRPVTIFGEVEPAITGFLTAQTRDEALRWVRRPQETSAKWDKWYAQAPYRAPGVAEIWGDFTVKGTGLGEVIQTTLLTGDHARRDISLVREKEGYLVDWDSWVGWSEMSWEEFLEKKPTEVQHFRVLVSWVDHYNHDFSDERKWASLRITPFGNENPVFGYSPRGSAIDLRIRPAEFEESTRWILGLKYPAGATRSDEVLVEEVVAEGWVGE